MIAEARPDPPDDDVSIHAPARVATAQVLADLYAAGKLKGQDLERLLRALADERTEADERIEAVAWTEADELALDVAQASPPAEGPSIRRRLTKALAAALAAAAAAMAAEVDE